jgi:hypothetical protein
MNPVEEHISTADIVASGQPSAREDPHGPLLPSDMVQDLRGR